MKTLVLGQWREDDCILTFINKDNKYRFSHWSEEDEWHTGNLLEVAVPKVAIKFYIKLTFY